MDDTLKKLHIDQDETTYENDIFDNWIDESLDINYLDACEIKDSTSLSGAEAKQMVLSFRQNGGKGSAVDYVVKRFEYEKAEGEYDRYFYVKKEDPYMVSDFI